MSGGLRSEFLWQSPDGVDTPLRVGLNDYKLLSLHTVWGRSSPICTETRDGIRLEALADKR